MPYQVKTEAMRVALAHREHDKLVEEIETKIRAKADALVRAGVNTEDALTEALVEDEEIQKLVVSRAIYDVIYETLIERGSYPTIPDDPNEPLGWDMLRALKRRHQH